MDTADTKQEAIRPKTAAAVKMAPVAVPGGQVAAVGPATAVGPVSEKDYISMLMSSPLFQQVEELQEMLDKQSGVGSAHVAGTYPRWSVVLSQSY